VSLGWGRLGVGLVCMAPPSSRRVGRRGDWDVNGTSIHIGRRFGGKQRRVLALGEGKEAKGECVLVRLGCKPSGAGFGKE